MPTTTGEPLPSRGEIWWIRADKKRPAVVVQTNRVREPRVRSFLVVPLTSRLHLAELPGNVRIARKASGLPKAAVANVYDIQKVIREDLLERVSTLPAATLRDLDDGMRLVLGL